ncbi:MAG: GspMb/PilO family protein [bacterium]
MTIEKRIVGTTSVLLLLTAAVVGFVILPSVRGIRQQVDDIADQQSLIEQRYSLRNYVKRITDDANAAAGGLERLRRTYVIENEELNFVQSMERAAALTGVQQDISLETANQTEINRWERRIPIMVRIRGQFPQVMGWLNEVEHLDYYVILDSLNVNTQKANGPTAKTGEVDTYVTGHVYWLSQSAPYFDDFDGLTPGSRNDDGGGSTDKNTN